MSHFLLPVQVEQTVTHDSTMFERLVDEDYIVVADRSYFKLKRFDEFLESKQLFVIRIKSNVKTYRCRASKRSPEEDSNVTTDYTCAMGTERDRSANRYRIVEFTDYEGKRIRVVTNLYSVNAEAIARIYKQRWAIESFFKYLKQQMNLAIIFGSTPNAVYNQLFGALLAYIVLQGLYQSLCLFIKATPLTFVQFTRKLFSGALPLPWQYFLPDSVVLLLTNFG